MTGATTLYRSTPTSAHVRPPVEQASARLKQTAAWLVGAEQQRNRTASTTTASHNGSVVQSAQLVHQEPFVQHDLMIAQGTLVYGASPPSNASMLTWQSGRDNDIRGAFIGGRPLSNTPDSTIRALNDAPLVMAFARDLDVAATTGDSAIFAVGHARDPVVQYLGDNRSSYFFTAHATIEDALAGFLVDYRAAEDRAIALDGGVDAGAHAAGGASYSALCALSLRQAMAGTELTIGGSLITGRNTSDVMLFVEEVGSQFAQTVCVDCPRSAAVADQRSATLSIR
jgi:hypothetical protein